MSWFLYIIRCRDKTLYTGITTNIPRRIREHNAGRGAFYTRNKAPVRLVYQETMLGRSLALKREAKIKRLNRAQKLVLIAGKK
jgi:putative endonuclease